MRIPVHRFGTGSSPRAARRFLTFIASAAFLFAAVGCAEKGADRSQESAVATSLDRLGGSERTVGVVGGESETTFLNVATEKFPQAQTRRCSILADATSSLESGEIDAVLFDRPTLEYVAAKNDAFVVLSGDLGEAGFSAATLRKNAELAKRVDEFVEKFRADGTCEKMRARWFEKNGEPTPEIPGALTPEGTLVVGVERQNEPASFVDANDQATGFNVEFARRLALFLRKDCRVETLNADETTAALESGKVDLLLARVDATPERRENFLFSRAYFDAPIAALARRDDGATASSGASAARKNAAGELVVERLEQFDDAKMTIGGEIGTVSLTTAQERFPKAKIANYQAPADAYLALKAGKIDAVAYDRPPMEYAAAKNPEFVVLPDAIGVGHIAVGGPFKNKELMKRVDEFIDQYRADGTYDAMYERWVKSTDPVMPEIAKAENPTGTLVIGFDPQNEPMSFLNADNEAVGFDAEFIKRLCLFLNMDYRLENMYYDALFPAIESEKLDLAVANLDATPERRETMLFSKDYLDCPAGLMMLKTRYGAANVAGAESAAELERPPFCERIERSFIRTFVTEARWKLILRGLWATVVITALSAILGTAFAFVLCCARRSRRAIFRIPAKAYISVIQGTPILVILLIFYYVVFAKVDADCAIVAALAWLTNLEPSEAGGVLIASIAFAINFSSYAGEMMRTGVDGVDRGLIEAAKALGFGRCETLRKITFPLATRRILPVYRGEVVSLLKTTSIVGYIAIQDLTKASDYIRSRTYEAFFPLIATAAIYFLAAYLLASGFAYMEYRLNPVTRRRLAQRRKAS